MGQARSRCGAPLPFALVIRVLTVAAATVVVALLLTGPASAFSRSEPTIVSTDGTTLAATLFVPDGTPPATGWPAVVFMHGLGGDRASMNALALTMGMIGEQYVVLTFDARGHGASGGLIGILGPNEVADVRSVFRWLRDRPDVADDRIGAFGMSYGGGAAWNSLAAGVPWAAIEPVETWTDLRAALTPQNLAKSGVIGGFLAGLPPAKVDPSVLAVRDASFAGRIDQAATWAAARSSVDRLRGVRTPVFMMQGRRDFAFGLDQVRRPWAALAGPKRLWIGNHGHPPSTFPGPDSAGMLLEGRRWFDRFLRGVPNGIDTEKPVVVAMEGSTRVTRYATLPRTRSVRVSLPGSRTIAQGGKVVRRSLRTTSVLEVFGAPTVKVPVRAVGGWSRVVAVLSARTPAGKEIVVAGGGAPTRPGRRAVTIRLIDQATLIPKGSTLTLTLASSSLAQDPANLLYLDLPMPATARATFGAATLSLPVLARPISR